MRGGGRWVVVSPFGIFGGRRRGRGYYPGYDPRFDRRYDRGYGRRNSGGGCLRDALLLEGGCCLAEAIGGNCLLRLGLLRLGLLLPALMQSFVGAGSRHGSRAQRGLLAVIASYQCNVSAHRSRPVCRYTPSCSAYAAEAITRYGAVTGTWRAVRRLLRCRPGTAGGFDPLDAALVS